MQFLFLHQFKPVKNQFSIINASTQNHLLLFLIINYFTYFLIVTLNMKIDKFIIIILFIFILIAIKSVIKLGLLIL
jgi:hypothetical protein